MLNKNVCPNCGQLYDTSLSKCPLCGTAPQVVNTAPPVQRKRITDAERRQRRSDRKEAEQASRRQKREARFMQDEEEELLIEEEDAKRREEKRRLKEERKAVRRAERNSEATSIPNNVIPNFTPGPARDGRGPMPPVPPERDRRRIPRVFLVLSTIVLVATLLVGGSYLLWKKDIWKLPIYEKLANKNLTTYPVGTDAKPSGTQNTEPAETEAPGPSTFYRGEGAIPCTGVALNQSSIVFTESGAQTQLQAELTPSDTTDERRFSSSDTSVVKVSPVGIVTAVGPGTAEITVTCGEQSAKCTVVCDFEADSNSGNASVEVDSLTLIKDDMTFFAAGENYVLSVTNVPVGTSVEWKSLDENICTVDAGGHVVAVGPGTTQVIATVGNLKAGCWVRCKFE